jgi:hypothetical protein
MKTKVKEAQADNITKWQSECNLVLQRTAWLCGCRRSTTHIQQQCLAHPTHYLIACCQPVVSELIFLSTQTLNMPAPTHTHTFLQQHISA